MLGVRDPLPGAVIAGPHPGSGRRLGSDAWGFVAVGNAAGALAAGLLRWWLSPPAEKSGEVCCRLTIRCLGVVAFVAPPLECSLRGPFHGGSLHPLLLTWGMSPPNSATGVGCCPTSPVRGGCRSTTATRGGSRRDSAADAVAARPPLLVQLPPGLCCRVRSLLGSYGVVVFGRRRGPLRVGGHHRHPLGCSMWGFLRGRGWCRLQASPWGWQLPSLSSLLSKTSHRHRRLRPGIALLPSAPRGISKALAPHTKTSKCPHLIPRISALPFGITIKSAHLTFFFKLNH